MSVDFRSQKRIMSLLDNSVELRMLSKSAIVTLLAENDRAVARALVVVNGNQTANERPAEATINRNGEGVI